MPLNPGEHDVDENNLNPENLCISYFDKMLMNGEDYYINHNEETNTISIVFKREISITAMTISKQDINFRI